MIDPVSIQGSAAILISGQVCDSVPPESRACSPLVSSFLPHGRPTPLLSLPTSWLLQSQFPCLLPSAGFSVSLSNPIPVHSFSIPSLPHIKCLEGRESDWSSHYSVGWRSQGRPIRRSPASLSMVAFGAGVRAWGGRSCLRGTNESNLCNQDSWGATKGTPRAVGLKTTWGFV